MVRKSFFVAEVHSDTAESELSKSSICDDDILVDVDELATNEFSAIIGVPAIYSGQRQHRD